MGDGEKRILDAEVPIAKNLREHLDLGSSFIMLFKFCKILSIKLGVMQGRLLPKYKGRFQAHPLGYWPDEFPIAAEFGLQCIEFIFDFNDYQLNPLWTVDGLKEIKIFLKILVLRYILFVQIFLWNAHFIQSVKMNEI